MRKIMWTGTILGTVIFVVSVFLAVYQRLTHGLPTRFSDVLNLWPALVVYLVACLLVGCVICSAAFYVRRLVGLFVSLRRVG